MDTRIETLQLTLALHARLFLNCLTDVDDATARRRLGDTNSLAFIACHLVDARSFLARLAGSDIGSPFPQLANVRAIDEVTEWPSLSDIRTRWSRINETLAARLEQLSAEDLERETEQEFPIGKRTLLGAVAFLVSHEAYHIGQMSLLRKHAGLGAMRYT
jgi:uncharacterized damage-inducible protein DinB